KPREFRQSPPSCERAGTPASLLRWASGQLSPGSILGQLFVRNHQELRRPGIRFFDIGRTAISTLTGQRSGTGVLPGQKVTNVGAIAPSTPLYSTAPSQKQENPRPGEQKRLPFREGPYVLHGRGQSSQPFSRWRALQSPCGAVSRQSTGVVTTGPSL